MRSRARENIATSTLAPVTSSRPEDWTWIAARCRTRWKPAVGLASPARFETRPRELVVEIVDDVAAEAVEIDAAGAQHGGSVLILGQSQQKVLERRIFVAPLVGLGQSSMQALLEVTR